MPTRELCDPALAADVARALEPSLSASCALACRRGDLGQQTFLQYHCQDIGKDAFDRASIQANLPAVRAIVPVVTGKTFHQKTAHVAVKTVSDPFFINSFTLSIDPSVYKQNV